MKKLLFSLLLMSNILLAQNPTLVIAHRGAAAMAPENTIVSFEKADEVGSDFFELDVQISSDGVLMIMHDGTINRTTNGTGALSSHTYDNLRLLDAGSWFAPEFAGEKIPTLEESLLVAKNSSTNIGVIVEIKSTDTRVPAKVVEVIKSVGMESRVVVSSFNLSTLTAIKNIDTSIPIQLFDGAINSTHINQVVAIGGEWVGSGGNFTQANIDEAHSKGLKFNSWTINGAGPMRGLIDLGVDAITTDAPVVLIAAMDDTPPTDVVLSSTTETETEVTLTWEEAVDSQSGIEGYEIFRDETTSPTTLIATVGTVLEYTDLTNIESTQFYYRIKAKNTAGLSSVNYSNELSVSTTADLTPPTVIKVASNANKNTVIIEFSERVDATTAKDTNNYTFTGSTTVSDAKLTVNEKSIILTTSNLDEQDYEITIENVLDRANTPNEMQSKTITFSHKDILVGAVAHYTLDNIDNGDLLDETTNNNDGLVTGGVSLSEGILGNGLIFDGVDSYVQFQNSPSFNVTGAVSISLWVKLDYLPTDSPLGFTPLFDSQGDQYVLYLDRGAGQLRFKIRTSGGTRRIGINNSDLVTGEWLHIMAVYDGTNAMVFLNGEKKVSQALTGTVVTGQVATLGRNNGDYFKGSMDEVQVYSRGFTDEEVMDMYKDVNDTTLSIAKEDIEFNIFNVYPNPNKGKFTVDLQSTSNPDGELVIFNSLGQKLFKSKMDKTGKQTVDCSSCGSGIYYVKIYFDSKIYSKQIVIL